MLILVRHGRTDANASGLLLGRLDPGLDELGVRQAEQLGDTLAASCASGATRVISSPLRRTRATADAIATAIEARTGEAAVVEIDDRWIELDYGELDGTPLADVPASTWASWRADPDFRPPGGESLVQLGARVRDALDSLVDAAVASDVVVVSHVSPIKAAVAWALGVGDEVSWRLFLAPASITRIRVGGPGSSLVGFNDLGHLA